MIHSLTRLKAAPASIDTIIRPDGGVDVFEMARLYDERQRYGLNGAKPVWMQARTIKPSVRWLDQLADRAKDDRLANAHLKHLYYTNPWSQPHADRHEASQCRG